VRITDSTPAGFRFPGALQARSLRHAKSPRPHTRRGLSAPKVRFVTYAPGAYSPT